MPTRRVQGFTLIEIMIVVAIIALLAMIAIPGFASARLRAQKDACLNNLRIISDAKQQYAMDNNNAAPGTMANLVPTYIARTPQCTAGGVYRTRSMARDPACNLGATLGHTI